MDNKLKVKAYDLYWLDKQKHIKAELERVIKEHNLESELASFEKAPADYVDLAKAKLGIDIEEEPVKETIKAPSKKVKKESAKEVSQISIGLDLED